MKKRFSVIEGGLPPVGQRLVVGEDGYVDIEASRLSPKEVQEIAGRQIDRDLKAGRNPFAERFED
jgi:hypothetical protein